jgi:prepilin-type N-terminal cleavage/methylation domain-containing protein
MKARSSKVDQMRTTWTSSSGVPRNGADAQRRAGGKMQERLLERRTDDGFTLVELLIVLIVLAILAGIVVFSVGTTGANAATSSCQADVKTFEVALEEYKSEVGAYPGAGILNSTGNPESNNGQDWANATPVPVGNSPSGAMFGLLGDNGYSASNTTFGTLNPVPNVTSAPTWTAPTNLATVGPLLRHLPTTQHYQIVTDGKGGLFVYPAGQSIPGSLTMDNPNFTVGDELNNPGLDTNSMNFQTDPGICSDTHVVS